MASDVDVCNLALSRLGDAFANIASINPPETSSQSQRCARFYPIALNSLLELYDWDFATLRVSLGALAQSSNQWQYTYATPNNAVRIFSILDPNANSDTTALLSGNAQSPPSYWGNNQQGNNGLLATSSNYIPQPFTTEILTNGTKVILTNQPNALCRYTTKSVDPQTFSPLFVDILSWYLASMLAGPMYKGEVGFQMSQECMKVFTTLFNAAKNSNGSSAQPNVQQQVSSIAARA